MTGGGAESPRPRPASDPEAQIGSRGRCGPGRAPLLTLDAAAQVDVLLGDPSKALKVLGWNPTKTPFVKVRPPLALYAPFQWLCSDA